jgi:hypothetical protein
MPVWFSAMTQLLLMLLVAAAYFGASRRYRFLEHPISIVLFVIGVGVTVAVAGEWLRDGWTGIPRMAIRSAIGSAGWGVIIASSVWGLRRGLAMRGKRT